MYIKSCFKFDADTKMGRLVFDPYVSLEHKTSHKQHGYICRNSQQYIVWSKLSIFSFMPKLIRILRSCSMKIFCKFPTVNISKLNYWLLICIAKNFIWTTLKMIFSIFRFFCTLRFQIYKYCPNHTSMEILFIQLSDDVYISVSQNWPVYWFCAPGSHMLLADRLLWSFHC